MKKSSLFKTVFSAILLASVISLFSQETLTVNDSKTFNVSTSGLVEIINKYGDIDIVSSPNTNVVKVDSEIKVTAKSKSKAQEILDRIDIQYSDSEDHVKIETMIESQKNSWFNSGWSNKTKFEINYRLSVPNSIKMDIQNKYGDLTMGDINNDVNVTLKYGKFDIGRLGNTTLDLGYSNGKVLELKDADVTIKYGDLKIGKTADLNITSKYSEINIDEAANIISETKYSDFTADNVIEIENDGKYDEFKIKTVNKVKFDTKYTDIELGILKIVGELETDYGSIDIDELVSDFVNLVIDGSYTDIDIDQIPNDCELDLKSEYADISVDDKYGKVSKDGNERWIKTKGSGSGKKIRIRSNYGDIDIEW